LKISTFKFKDIHKVGGLAEIGLCYSPNGMFIQEKEILQQGNAAKDLVEIIGYRYLRGASQRILAMFYHQKRSSDF
jgi:hypothetical protein